MISAASAPRVTRNITHRLLPALITPVRIFSSNPPPAHISPGPQKNSPKTHQETNKMSGGRGCFNCGGCALSSLSLSSSFPPTILFRLQSLMSPNHRVECTVYRSTPLHYLPGTPLTMLLPFFSHLYPYLRNTLQNPGTCRRGRGANIIPFFKQRNARGDDAR